MSLPAAVAATVSWIKNPYGATDVVKVSKMTKRKTTLMFIISVPVTVLFYFLLALLKTPNLIFSTLSVTTSFIASYLSFMRSPYFALAYATNDVVLIVLWILAAAEDISYLPMVLCFVMFLLNDCYGFISWKRMERLQNSDFKVIG
jgi:nicotinamide riboside transporter PnuC